MRFLTLSIVFFIPSLVFAAETSFFGPLVPQCNAWHGICQACDLVELADNLIKLFVAVSVLAASLIMAYAGFLLVTASGNQSNIDSAKKIFWSTFLGLILVLISVLLVDTILRAIAKQDLNALTSIDCTSLNRTSGTFEFDKVTPPPPVTGTQGGGATSTPSQ